MSKERKPSDSEENLLTLCIDIGGTGLKSIVLDSNGHPVNERLRVDTPRPAKPSSVLAELEKVIDQAGKIDRVSVGFPGVVIDNVVKTAPNLHETWADFPLGNVIEKRTKKPTRVINDAGVQGYGAIQGKGVEMVITLGTGMGCALFLDGRYVPNLELAHHPFRKGKTYEEYVGIRALEVVGKKKWNRHVQRVIAQILPIWNPQHLYIGGGNAKKLSIELPSNVTLVDNMAGLLGGIALWRFA